MIRRRDGTRAERATRLRARIVRGPSFDLHELDTRGTAQDVAERIRARYQGWVESWILDELDSLVPELRKAGLKSAAARADT